MPFEAIAGFIFANRAGREPHGCVAERELHPLIEEIRQKLAQQKSPHSGRPLFDALKTPQEVYASAATSGEAVFPELFALPARGVNFVRKLSFGPSVEIPAEKHRGTHRPEGFFCLSGAGAIAGKSAEASIEDIAPTILAALGQGVPMDMTGRPLAQFFAEGLSDAKAPPSSLLEAQKTDIYSADEQKLIEQRLADLGYVE
jgi:predicted AlkP superfamily phosphohydrolase/phosphomutase